MGSCEPVACAARKGAAMRAEELREGMRVTYVPHHAFGIASHLDCERGVVTSWSPRSQENGAFLHPVTVFVRYGNDQNSKATSLENLVPG